MNIEEKCKIPKIIHYCWFGKSPLPESAIKCIDSWKKFFPDYEIKEWNESNFDIESCNYVKEAYEYKKWAFASDYARFKILYEEGGIYFDTDVEVIKSFKDILEKGGFMGQEKPNDSVNKIFCAPGLGIAANPGLKLYKDILDYYESIHFVKADGNIDTSTICDHVTHILKLYGYDDTKEEIQAIAGITIYPPEYFCPQEYVTGKITITDNTRSIHYYSATWHSKWDNIVSNIERCHDKKRADYRFRRIVSFPFRCVGKIDSIGWKKAGKLISDRIIGKLLFKKV